MAFAVLLVAAAIIGLAGRALFYRLSGVAGELWPAAVGCGSFLPGGIAFLGLTMWLAFGRPFGLSQVDLWPMWGQPIALVALLIGAILVAFLTTAIWVAPLALFVGWWRRRGRPVR